MQLKRSYFGENCLSSTLKTIFSFYRPKRIFVVTGKKYFAESLAKEKMSLLFAQMNITPVYYNDFDQNPNLEDVERGINHFVNSSCDLVLAIGGGSVLDIAKMINIFAHQKNSLAEYLQKNTGIQVPGFPLIAIPTTAGTGSEATHFSVLYINKVKHSVAHKFMLPAHAIIDPVLTYQCPPSLTAVTGFDTFTQAIESFWAVGATNISQRYAKRSIKLCMRSLLNAIKKQDDFSRKEMAIAAHFSGKAIDISKTTAPHALSYELTMKYGISHGHAVALTIPLFIKINSEFNSREINEPRGVKYLDKVVSTLYMMLGCNDADECILLFKKMMIDAGLKPDLKSLNITQTSEIEHIIKSVNFERLRNNPVKIEDKELLSLLQATEC